MSNQKYDFKGKVALVTGSSGQALGAQTAILLAKYGAKLTITGRNVENLQKVADEIEKVSGLKPLQIVGDLEDRVFVPTLVQETIKKYGQLDVLINNAGFWSADARVDNPGMLELFDKLINVNVRPALQLVQAAAPYLEKVKGSVVNISSMASLRPVSDLLECWNAGFCLLFYLDLLFCLSVFFYPFLSLSLSFSLSVCNEFSEFIV